MPSRNSAATRAIRLSARIAFETSWTKKMRKATLVTAKRRPTVTERNGTKVAESVPRMVRNKQAIEKSGNENAEDKLRSAIVQ